MYLLIMKKRLSLHVNYSSCIRLQHWILNIYQSDMRRQRQLEGVIKDGEGEGEKGEEKEKENH